jgi:diamine N-acetyltransferase
MYQNILGNEVVKLRALEPSDVDLLYSWENNMEIWKVSNTITPFSRHILLKYIESAHLDIWETKQLRLVIEAKDDSSQNFEPIGMIDLFDFEPYHLRAGIGILIANIEFRNKGYAKEALNVLIKYAFDTLQLHQLYCNIDTTNIVSLKLFQNAGFSIIGEKKQWLKYSKGWVGEILLQLINPMQNEKGN